MPVRINQVQAGDHAATSAIIALLVFTGSMLLAMFSRAAPHSPLDVAPIALGPFLAASLATEAAAHVLVARGAPYAMAIALLFALTAQVSYGPQESVEAANSRAWPAVIFSQIAIAVITCLAACRAVRLIRAENRVTALCRTRLPKAAEA